MIVSTYYNKANDVLTMTTVANKFTTMEKKDNVAIMYNDDKVVAINVFNPQGEYTPGLVDISLVPAEYTSLFAESVKNPFIVGEIKAIQKHPKSEKLNVCQVQLDDDNETQIVCGAANVEENKKVIVAQVGAVMNSGMAIVSSKLIDVQSNGMICSYRELGLEQDTAGIALLDDQYVVGESFVGKK